MGRGALAILLAAALPLSGLLRAEDAKPHEKKPEAKVAKKGNPDRIYPRGPEFEKLRTDLGLTDEQIAQAKEAVAAVSKQNDELLATKEVAEAEAEVKKAKEALKAAEVKVSAAKHNFDLNDEYKKAVFSIVPEDKKEKASQMLHYKPKAEKKTEKKAEKPDKKKSEEKQAEEKKPDEKAADPATLEEGKKAGEEKKEAEPAAPDAPGM